MLLSIEPNGPVPIYLNFHTVNKGYDLLRQCDRSEVVRSGPGQLLAGWAGARPVSFSLSSHNSRAAASSRAAADGSRRWRLT